MRISLIKSINELETHGENWKALYEQDPDAQHFLSFEWMYHYLASTRKNWTVLAATPADSELPVAYLPIRMQVEMNNSTKLYSVEIQMGGNSVADYTGAVCKPEYAKEAIEAFCRKLKEIKWHSLNFKDWHSSEERRAILRKAFSNGRYKCTIVPGSPNKDGIDSTVFPYVELPDDWETYLNEKLSSNMRQKLRRIMRKVDSDPAYTIRLATSETINEDVETLLSLWRQQWGHRKGKRLEGIVRSYRNYFLNAFKNDTFFLPILFYEDHPVTALGIYRDEIKREMLFNMGGRDLEFNKIQVGLVLHGFSIRWAIENGFKTYNFLQGDEAYKYSFGSVDHHVNDIVIKAVSHSKLGQKLDPIIIPHVFKKTADFHKNGKLMEAEAGYSQLLASDSEHTGALYGYAQVLMRKRRFSEAIGHLERLTELRPDNPRGWLRLGQACNRAGNLAKSVKAFRKAISLDPALISAQHGLAQVLVKQERKAEAIETLDDLLTLPARNDTDRSRLADAKALAERLRRETLFEKVPVNLVDLGLDKAPPLFVQSTALPPATLKSPSRK